MKKDNDNQLVQFTAIGNQPATKPFDQFYIDLISNNSDIKDGYALIGRTIALEQEHPFCGHDPEVKKQTTDLHRAMTHEQLCEYSQCLASYIIERFHEHHKTEPENKIVAIYLDHTIDAAAAMLSIMMSGAGLPIIR